MGVLEKLVETLTLRFTSGNSIQADRAHIRREEFDAMRDAVFPLDGLATAASDLTKRVEAQRETIRRLLKSGFECASEVDGEIFCFHCGRETKLEPHSPDCAYIAATIDDDAFARWAEAAGLDEGAERT